MLPNFELFTWLNRIQVCTSVFDGLIHGVAYTPDRRACTRVTGILAYCDTILKATETEVPTEEQTLF